MSRREKDGAVEALRLFACFTIVFVHTMTEADVFYHASYHLFNRFLRILFLNGVGIFMLITGMFIFNNQSWKKLIINTIRKILIPSALIMIVTFYFREFLCIEGTTLKESMTHSIGEYVGVARDILSFKPGVAGVAHLWYVFSYVQLIILFPLLKAGNDYLAEQPERERVFLIISAAMMLLNDFATSRFIP